MEAEPMDMPSTFHSHGIHISTEDYTDAVQHLIRDKHFQWHIWCYNMPAAMILLTFFLALCLTMIPLLDSKFVFHGHQTGLEYVHATVLWLCVLTLYIIILQIVKVKLKSRLHKKLGEVNTCLIRYNLLVGIEDLSITHCNKYTLHFFYYELGPCLGHLQELLVNGENGTCFHSRLGTAENDVTINMEGMEDAGISDTSQLNAASFTNAQMQSQAEDLILQYSGEYVTLLIAKKLDCPAKNRHLTQALCMCQYVERKLYNISV